MFDISNSRTKIRQVLAVTLTLVCTGCMPVTVYDSPQVHGQILDAKTAEPIAGAQVVVKTKADLTFSGTSDSSGRFEIAAAKRQIWMPPFPFDPVWPNAEVDVSAPGFESQTLTVYKFPTDGVIRLKRQ